VKEYDRALPSYGQVRTRIIRQPQITKSLSEEIIHRVGLPNRSEGRDNQSPDASEPVEGGSLVGV